MRTDILILEIEHPTDLDAYEDALRRACPQASVRTAASRAEAVAKAAGAEVLASKAHAVSAELIAAMPRLKWIQALTTGVDHLVALPLPPNVLVTNVRGMHGPQMSELAFLYMISLSRDFRRMLRNQDEGVWARWPQRLLYEKTAVIVGVGSISEALASRCKAFGMRVIGVSSTRRSAPAFDSIVRREDLTEAARAADFLIVLAPLNESTRGMVGAATIDALKPDCIFINIARGPVVDEASLLRALGEGRIRGAGLDVFESEPLPKDHPFWTMDNVIVTPRVGGMSDVYARQACDYLVENVRRFTSDPPQPLLNPVNF